VRPTSGGVWKTLPGLEHVWNAFNYKRRKLIECPLSAMRKREPKRR
jgi:hypothetical protein